MAGHNSRRAGNFRTATVAVISALTIGMVFAGQVLAAAPVNDSRLRPRIIDPGTLSGASGATNVGATVEAREPIPTCQTNIGASVWWRYRPPADMIMTLQTAPNGSSLDTVLAVYKSTGAGLQQISCSDDYQATQYSKVALVASANVQYLIQVSGFANQQSNFELDYSFVLANDAFARAKRLGIGYSDDFSNGLASVQSGEPSSAGCPGITNTVWYRYQPTVTQDVEFDTFGSSFDTVVNVWQGTAFSNFRLVTCSDDADSGDNGPSLVTWHATKSSVYYIQVGGYHTFGNLVVTFDRY